jgi:hypothetical protein
MKKTANQFYIYIYLKDDRGDFWTSDGQLYHHFIWKDENLWYVRPCSYLPANLFGASVPLNFKQQLSVRLEAACYGITLPIFKEKEECDNWAWQSASQQAIFGLTPSAGYLTSDGLVVYPPDVDFNQ